MDKKITIKGKRSRDVSKLDWENALKVDADDALDAVSAGALGVGTAMAGDNPVFGNVLSGIGAGAQFGLFGAVAGAGLGLMNGLKQKDMQELAEQRQENLNQYDQDRTITQALRSDWIANSNPVMAAQNGATVDVQAMVAPGETIITEDGRVVRVKGKGNKDIVPWTDGPATVLGNLKMNGTGMKYKDFGKIHFKETKEGVKEAPGNFGARAVVGKILANMQENDKKQQGIKPKTAVVTNETLANLDKAKAPKVVAANFGTTISTIGQLLPLLASIPERMKPAKKVQTNYNELAAPAMRFVGQNTYDYVGGLRDIAALNRAMTYNANAMGNSSGVNALSRIAAHTQSLKGMRDIRRDYSLAQAEANKALGDFMYRVGESDVAARNLRDDLQARDEAAAFKNRQSVYQDIGKLANTVGKDLQQNEYQKQLLNQYQKWASYGDVSPATFFGKSFSLQEPKPYREYVSGGKNGLSIKKKRAR